MVGPDEHEALDFKVTFRSDHQRHLAAMAMTSGGLIVLGIDHDAHRIEACPLTADLRDRITGTAQDIGLSISLRELEVAGRPITVVAVPEVRGRIVTTSDGRVLRRVGSASRPLVGDGLARFVRERTRIPAEEDELAAFDAASLSRAAINEVLEAAGRPRLEPGEDPSQVLVDLGLAERPPGDPRGLVVHLAALIAFGEDPTTTVPGARVQLVRRQGRHEVDAPVSRRESFTGPIIDVVESVVETIVEGLPTFEAVTGLRRRESTIIPLTAIREVIVNAVAHRDYGLRNATVDVAVTDDSLTVQSPGPLPGHVTVANIRTEHYSRNPRLMHLLQIAGLVEDFGDGVDRIFEDMAERLLPEPVYVATDASVMVTLRASSALTLEQQTWLGTLSDVSLSRDDRRVLVVAREEGQVTRRRARDLSLEADAGQVLRSMVRRRLLEPRGRRGGKHYVLSSEVRARSGDTSILAEQARRNLVEEELHRRGDGGLSTREAATLLGEDELRGARQLLNDLVQDEVAVARGRTSGRRYYAR